MHFTPKKHHRLAVWHLVQRKEAALFAGLGLGKTASALLAFKILRLLGLSKSMLVVAPLRVACLTWPNEIEKWGFSRRLTFSDLRTAEGMAELQSGTSDIYLINYEQLIKFAKTYLSKKRNTPYPFDIVCYDELTCAKGHNSKRINRIRKRLVAENGVARRWGLTGTPTPNSLAELFAQIRLLDGGQRFGPSHSAFMECYFKSVGYGGYSWELLPGSKEKIYDRIQDIALSLPSSQYADILEPVTEDLEVALPAEVREQYQTISKKLLLQLKDGTEIVAISAGVLVNKLQQITGGTVYREDKSVVKLHSAKLERLKKLVQKHRGQPLIIACNYNHEKKRILKALAGAQEFQNTKEFLAKWNAGRVPIIVTHPKSLGHGLNMQDGGHLVVWYSMPWSRELYDQLNGRVARTGQKQRCRIYRIVCPGTIDDAIVETLRERGDEQRVLMNILHNYRRLVGWSAAA